MNRTLIEPAGAATFPGVLVSPATGAPSASHRWWRWRSASTGTVLRWRSSALVAALPGWMRRRCRCSKRCRRRDVAIARSPRRRQTIQLLSGQFETLGIRALHSAAVIRRGAKRRRS